MGTLGNSTNVVHDCSDLSSEDIRNQRNVVENTLNNLNESSIENQSTPRSTSEISSKENERKGRINRNNKGSGQKKNELTAIKILNLNTFKTKLCTNHEPNHNLKMCSAYHEKTKDRRRPPGSYKSELCSYIAKKK
jgi:hypothetical protein